MNEPLEEAMHAAEIARLKTYGAECIERAARELCVLEDEIERLRKALEEIATMLSIAEPSAARIARTALEG